MKKIYLIALLFVAFAQQLFAKDIAITIPSYNSSNNNIPVQAQVGDVLVFTTGSPHTATQVSKDTWDNAAGGDFPALAGGFNFASSSSTQSYIIKDSDVGIIYFGCIPHAQFGMKGMVNVTAVTGVTDPKFTNTDFTVYPNPTTGVLKFNNPGSYDVEILNVLGVEVEKLSVDNNSVDLSHLAQGVYIIRFRKDGVTFVKRVIKK